MIETIRRIGSTRKKRRIFIKIRQEFANYGHRLDGVPDARIEAALTKGDVELDAASLSAKPIYLALRRLSLVTKRRQIQKTGQSGS